MVACVAWRFLGAQSNKGGRGQWNREEIGEGATYACFCGFAALSCSRQPCYADYSNGGSVLGCPLSLEVSKLYTFNTFNSSNKLRFDEKNCPDSYQINSFESCHRYPKFIFPFFFSVCLSFLSVLFGYGKPWRVNNGKVNTQVEALIKLGRLLRSPDKGKATEKPYGRGFVSSVVWDVEKIGKNSTNTTWRMTTAIWRISVRLKILLYPEFAKVQTKEDGKLTSAVWHFKTADWTRIVDCKL